ncbi:hypothetical protein NA56DRAFT_445371 [Hyaloscypha hepaticicola]|uniref:Tat pathway signal sequence n=1 Tax=Hyaloscypha hepaticicola TaxID=2082293 RepID=A0A2J6PGH6_9HELO|nr:hypothetical protein NA56DRAFT_445371 [Hyaloscypha hepaticicola]
MFSKASEYVEKYTAPRSPIYDPVDTQFENEDPSHRRCSSGVSSLWVLSTCAFAFAFAISTWRQYSQTMWSYENGFRTDFGPARPSISIEEVRFTSGVWIDDNGTFHLTEHPGIPTYVGPPSPDIDKHWDSIIKPEWFHATQEEIVQYGGSELAEKLLHSANGIYSVELDVFHSLHCLNQIRKAIDRDYYYPSYGSRNDTIDFMHWDHCIDQLRQVLQCHSDTTMNGAIWYPGGDKSFVDTEDTHTCRNFTKLREWRRARTSSNRHPL